MTISRRHFLSVAAALTVIPRQTVRACSPGSNQQRIAEAFAARTVGSKIIYDHAGNVVKLAISRHTGQKSDDLTKLPPGVTDAEFGDILKLPMLQAVFIEKMPLSDESYALLGQLKHLRDVRIHYPAWSKTQTQDGRTIRITEHFGEFINHLPTLQILQFKHIFRLDGDGLARIQPQSELEHLEIDTICAKSSAVPFITASKKLKNLQIHRCEWTDAHLQTVLASLPALEVLELKPTKVAKDSIGGHSLRGLARCPQLKILQLTGDFDQLRFAGGLDAISNLPSLRQVTLIFNGMTIESESVRQLHRANPRLLIKVGNQSLGGDANQKPQGIDDGYDWGGTVTTHG